MSSSPLNIQQDKDIGKYNQALAQAMDGISAKAAFIEVRGGRGNDMAYELTSFS